MGADTERVYTLFIGPPEKEAEWSDEAVAGAHRFLQRVWRLLDRLSEAFPTAPADAALERERHATIQRVTHSMQRFSFNTAVAALMELSNSLHRALEEKTASRLALRRDLRHPAPAPAPHGSPHHRGALGAAGLYGEPARDLLAGARRDEAPARAHPPGRAGGRQAARPGGGGRHGRREGGSRRRPRQPQGERAPLRDAS